MGPDFFFGTEEVFQVKVPFHLHPLSWYVTHSSLKKNMFECSVPFTGKKTIVNLKFKNPKLLLKEPGSSVFRNSKDAPLLINT